MDINRLSEMELARMFRCFLFEGTREDTVKLLLEDFRCTLEEFLEGQIIYDTDRYRCDLGFILSGGVEIQKPSPSGGGFIRPY